MSITAEKLKQIRLECCMSQAEFAAALGVTKPSISYYERGKRQPSFKTVRKLFALVKKYGIKVKLPEIRID